ncbi:MAG: AMP-binding protein [Acidimicrobiia bacterium]
MIEWLRRVEPGRPFLSSDERVWTYGETLAEVEARMTERPRVITPSLSAESVFDVVAGMAGGGATVLGPNIDRPPGAAHSTLVVFTSGTTGPPRGVRLTGANLRAASAASAAHLGHDTDDNWLLAMPLHHVGGLSIVVRQVFTGGSVTLLPEFDPATFAGAMRGRVSMVSVVPTMLRRVIGYGPFRGLRAVLVGGGPIPDGLLEEAEAAGLPALPTYGMTETFGQVATLKPGFPLERKAYPLPGIELRIEPDGRVAVRGEQVSPGYVGEPDRADPWLVTNDLGTLDDDGALRIAGRVDTVIVTGGENVDPARVEEVIRGHAGVDEVVVVGVPDEEWGQVLVAVYSGSVPATELRDWTTARLPRFMVPKRWTLTDEIPRTAIGKPDRAASLSLGLGADD